MKKHPILYTFLFLLFIIFIFTLLVIRDVLHIKNYIAMTSATKAERMKNIGIEKLCNLKNIDYDNDKRNIEDCLKYLISVHPKYINYDRVFKKFDELKIVFLNDHQKDQPTEEDITDLKNKINQFDESLKMASIKDFDWNIFDPTDIDPKQPLKRTIIYGYLDLTDISIFISLTDSYINKNNTEESTIFFKAVMKVFLLNLYMNKGEMIHKFCDNLDGLFIFYDKLINNQYTEQEMKSMLTTVKGTFDLLPDLKEYLKINYDDSKRLYDFAFKQFPVISNTVSLLSGNPYPELDKIYEQLKEGKYKEVTDLFSTNPNLSYIFISPALQYFYIHHNSYIDIISRLALFQAYLEDKLKLEITALDPYDKSPIRFTVDEKGTKHFYCLGHEGKDYKGLGNNISNCDSKLKNILSSLEKEQEEKRD